MLTRRDELLDTGVLSRDRFAYFSPRVEYELILAGE